MEMITRGLLLLGLLTLCCCNAGDATRPGALVQAQAAQTERAGAAAESGDFRRVIPWGAGASEVGLWPSASDRQAAGPSAVAVGPSGAVFVLDQINGRVLQVSAAKLQVVARPPQHAGMLALSSTGDLAVYSPLHHRVQIFHRGESSGEVSVPTVFRQVNGIVLEPSRTVLIQLAYQEMFSIGSPALPQTLATVLHSKREGAFLLADGNGVAVRLDSRRWPEVLIVGQGDHHPVLRSFHIQRKVLAARIIGVAGDTVCLRLELASGGSPVFRVQRKALCLQASTGEVIDRRDLPPPGLYQPRQELALGGSPPRLALISPTEAGLVVQSWAIAAAADRRQP